MSRCHAGDASMISERLEAIRMALGCMRSAAPVLSVGLPVRLVNTSNRREHWRATAKRAKHVRALTNTVVLRGMTDLAFPLEWRIVSRRLAVRLVYVGPRQLDDDGVASAVKSLRDGVADALGVDDRDPRVVWVPDQERGGVREYGARVEIYLA